MAKTVREVLIELGSKKKGKSSRKKGGDKKHGRNKVKCGKYRVEGRREKNKLRKQRKIQRLLAKKKRRIQ